MYTKRKAHIKSVILDHIRTFCYGFRNAKKRADIIKSLPIEISDRLFRRICSELRHEGHIATHNSRGYWFVVLYTNDPEEVQAFKESWLEDRAKALDMLRDCDRNIKQAEDRFLVKSGRQYVMEGV